MSEALKVVGFVLIGIVASVAGWFSYQNTQYDFRTLNGDTYSWHNLEGQWVVINYFAPWCVPCLREMPELNALNKSLPQSTQLFAINYDKKNLAELNEMVLRYAIDIPVIVTDERTQLPMQKPTYLPATFIVGPQGKVITTIMGEVTAEEVRRRIRQLKDGGEAQQR